MLLETTSFLTLEREDPAEFMHHLLSYLPDHVGLYSFRLSIPV